MRYGTKILGLVALCLLAAIVSTGCAKKPVVTTASVQPEPVEATSAVTTEPQIEEPPAVADGPITTPAAGTEERTTLLDAARLKLGTSAQFVVYQLFVQGDYALADIEPSTGGTRQFVGLTGPKWKAVWVAPYGTAEASSAAAKSGISGISDELVAKIDWKYKKPASSSSLAKSLSTAAQKWAKSLMEGQGAPYEVTLVKVAKDSKGVWWGRAIVQPTATESSSFESIEFWAKYSGGAWAGKAQDPEPPAPTTYFPSSVTGALGF